MLLGEGIIFEASFCKLMLLQVMLFSILPFLETRNIFHFPDFQIKYTLAPEAVVRAELWVILFYEYSRVFDCAYRRTHRSSGIGNYHLCRSIGMYIV